MGRPKSSNRIVQCLWIGSKLSTIERLSLQSFITNGHTLHLYTYTDITGVPQEAVVKDASEIIPADKLFLDDRGTVASFADWFRYKLLYEKGGWWIDTDAICLRYFNVRSQYCFSTEWRYQDRQAYMVNNGFIKSPPGAPFLADLLGYIESQSHAHVRWGDFGPRLITDVLRNYDSGRYICEPDRFCPVNWDEMHKLINGAEITLRDDCYAIHLWNDMWKRYNLNKDGNYHPESIFEKLKQKYLGPGYHELP